MDSDTHPTRRVGVPAVLRERSSSDDQDRLPQRPTIIGPGFTEASPTSATSWPETVEPVAQASFSGLIGALALRAIRTQHNR
ncbi:MAG: hypothetical protein HLUCCA11_24515 [Phormidesmis priestleyi Ana]|uniref:Uncharacterized protein n=1 Tax=Phormidesmis priestleyi Ana TaxID=1666911 RepID=A0A0P7Z8C8_9CYAN|nr:MAG: hypothetical protein HLUCCA11_24515 [Phormidesmis priestleyi Ana]